MSQLSLYTDEDVYADIAPQLRRHGWDVISVTEAGRTGLTDSDQLQWAFRQGRAMCTFNTGDFARLHFELLTRGDHHAGIVVSAQVSLGTVVRRLQRLMGTLSAEDMQDRLEYLSNW